ncbi:MAG TPA: cobyric acid synthase [Negativicutes bacterium]|nr:cobyric acid synthase [Negativicutes bacterium]
MAKTIMFQGTSSHVGKSILTTALCRIFRQDGYRVVPFKAQNMALNSYVTPSGGEMGRAQVAQAEAAGLEPAVEMNPVLLKPTGNSRSQVIVMGRPIGVMSASEYHAGYSTKLLGVISECLTELQERFDIVVIEGAGSPAEVNLKANDIVNMRIALMVNAPVFLIADIDRGGAIASVVGTLSLLEPEEQDLVQGIILNKFRGDINLLRPAFDVILAKTGKPVVGVIPHLADIGIDDEDSVSLDDKTSASGRDLEIAVLRLPKISNFTDFDPLLREPDVSLRYVREGEALGKPDLIILPGSKNTTEDMLYLKEQGFDASIRQLAAQGTPVIGICGGYQMLGQKLADPLHTESDLDELAGLGLIPAVTTFAPDKVTHQVLARMGPQPMLGAERSAAQLSGYEIHMGRTEFVGPVFPAFSILQRSGQPVAFDDGFVSADGLVMGTYIHGIFENDGYRRSLLDALRVRKGLPPLAGEVVSYLDRKEAAYNKLADLVRANLDMEHVRRVMGLEP